jgi:uncharacterized membrane protein YfcA
VQSDVIHTYIWVCLIFLASGFVQGVSGFGSVLLSLPLLAMFLDIKAVIPLSALAGVSVSYVLLYQLRRYLDWKKILPIFTGAALGIPVGVFFLKRLDTGTIECILGVILILYALYGLFFSSSIKGIDQRWAYVYGFLGGCLGASLSAGGPPVIIYTSLQAWGKDQIKATIQGFFVTAGTAVVVSFAVAGVVTGTVIRLYCLSFPLLMLGTFLGSRLYGYLKEDHYRTIMFILLGLLGMFSIYRA